MARNSSDHPALWRSIGLSGPDAPLLEQVTRWLSRSGCCPLSVVITESTESKVIAAVVLHCARWEHFVLKSRSPSHLLTIQVPTPLLRNLHLDLEESSDPPLSIVIFREAPLLRSGIFNYFAAANVAFPWLHKMRITDGITCNLTRGLLRPVYSCESVTNEENSEDKSDSDASDTSQQQSSSFLNRAFLPGFEIQRLSTEISEVLPSNNVQWNRYYPNKLALVPLIRILL
ncbi:hypothetical protein B0H19DRAFT_1058415 [Mycena capillaripes]|nr:hypothetical protein B0H19DRAFT_1058415 [Mycena capillaripes]